jgi:aldose sugar dehydrogenase
MRKPTFFFGAITLLCFLVLSYNIHIFIDPVNGSRSSSQDSMEIDKKPLLRDPLLRAELVVKGLPYPTSIAFLGPNEMLVTENKAGRVHRIVDGGIVMRPLLDINVANFSDRCMCGIAISEEHSTNGQPYVFLYFTEAQSKVDEDRGGDSIPLGNRLYRYELDDNRTKLINPKLLLALPATPGAWHNGGAISIGPDSYIYVPIGDVNASYGIGPKTTVQNYKNGTMPDGRAGILRIGQDGSFPEGILGETFPLNLYYAYGIRNSYGIDFDPVTGRLWETENGPVCGDEVNLVEPGFNSGWDKIQGMSSKNRNSEKEYCHDWGPDTLMKFDGRGTYSDPEFVWGSTVAPTALVFLNTDKLGKQYQNDLFVAEFTSGNILHFDLTANRTNLSLTRSLSDKIADSNTELDDLIFAENRAGVTDMVVGPDGYLYVAVYDRSGEIYRIVPSMENASIG